MPATYTISWRTISSPQPTTPAICRNLTSLQGFALLEKNTFEKYYFVNFHFALFCYICFACIPCVKRCLSEVTKDVLDVHIHLVLQRYQFYPNTNTCEVDTLTGVTVHYMQDYLAIYTLKHKYRIFQHQYLWSNCSQ